VWSCLLAPVFASEPMWWMGGYSVFKAVGRGMSGCPVGFPKNEAQDVSMSEIFMQWRKPTDCY
jgi:hypothetical protein